jgi:hypothetical protein
MTIRSRCFPAVTREHITHGYAITVHSAQGATADTCHAVLGETSTRATLYVAMTRGRDGNTAYLYERVADHEHGGEQTGVHVMQRDTSRHAGQLVRSIIANDDRPLTALDMAAHAPGVCPAGAGGAQAQRRRGLDLQPQP